MFSTTKRRPQCPTSEYFNKITSTMKFPNVPSTSVKLMLFPFSLEGAAQIWLEKEPPRSILTWDDLVSKFINKFFPPSKTTNLRNEITRFQQKFDETFYEAWDRFNDLLRGCPHSGERSSYPADFVVVDYVADPRAPLILGRPFLRTTRALIDVHGEQMTLRHDDQSVTFKVLILKPLLQYHRNRLSESDVIDICLVKNISRLPLDQEKTTFTCPYRTFAYRRMPFGLCNAPGTFQRCMVAIFHNMIEKTMEVFMDDFSVFGDSFSSCLSHLDKMLQRCEDTNLVLNWEKCQFNGQGRP
ncbi:reverse transcriptase domain-containing protein [Tanacetum coccineum]